MLWGRNARLLCVLHQYGSVRYSSERDTLLARTLLAVYSTATPALSAGRS